jgi:AraC-like DNA-binding protein
MTLRVTDRLRPAIHPTYARLLCAHLRQSGFDTATIFQGTRLRWEQLLGENRFLSLEQMARLIRRAVKLTDKPWLGLEVGEITMVSAHGPVGYAAVASRDLRQVLETVTRYSPLRLQIMTYRFEETAEEGVIRAEEHFDFGDAREYILSTNLATMFRLVETITAQPLREATIELPFPEPEWGPVYEEKLGCPVRFGHPAYAVRLPASLLDTPCLTADPMAWRTAVRECEHALHQMESGGALTQRIRNLLLESEGRYPTLEELAGEFAMSRRTLIRKLKAEETSYQELLDEVRQELAAWYLLNTEEPVERVAEKLGYRDTSNFSRTFRRWFGENPRSMRARRSGR